MISSYLLPGGSHRGLVWIVQVKNFLYVNIAAKGQIGYAEYQWEKLDELAWFRSLMQQFQNYLVV